jgi:alpha-tubulin suppressor-like RCC1 family protein
VAAGALHSLAVRNDGTVWAWGWNVTGQLGDGTTVDRHSPVQVSGLTGATSVAAGVYHTLALRSDGTVRAWGWNGAGQLGDGTTTDRHSPVAVAGITQIAGIAAGYYHSVALTRSGAVGAWGWNGAGQLGDGTTVDRRYAVHVIGLSGGVRRVAAGAYHSLAITTGGTVTGWGWNYYGQLGNGSTVQRNASTPAAGPVTAVDVAGGAYHTLTG